MTHAGFDQLVKRVEAGLGQNPQALYRRVLRLALLGYAGLLAPLALVLAVGLVFLVPGILQPRDGGVVLLGLGAVVIAVGGWSVGRALWVQLPPPQGRVLARAEAPLLFARLDELQNRLRSAPFHEVQIVPDCNAAVAHRPRLGVFGWHKNYLLLGLPLLESLSPAELLAVLAHECAHLSKQHHRSGQWIYRLRRSWQQTFDKLAQPRPAGEISLRPLTRQFVQWFWPRFDAHAFVLSRTYECQADTLAAELAGKEPAATALIRIAWYGRVLDRRFWPEVWQQTKTAATPPEGVFQRLRDCLAGIDQATEAASLDEAFRSTTTNADTHPCLVERLRTVGWTPNGTGPSPAPSVLAPVSASAAAVWLGPALPAIRADLEQRWRQECAPLWRQRHAKAGVLQDRLQNLDQALERKRADIDALWDKATTVLELQDHASAEPLLRQILTLDPAHVAANFNLGQLLLHLGNSDGEAFLERAVQENEELLPQAASLLHAFYGRTGQSDRLRQLYTRLDAHEKSLAASRLERSNVTAADTLIPHDLGAPDLAALLQVLAAEPDIVSADLARKALRYFAQQKLFLLCIRLRLKWHRLPAAEREQAVIQRLIQSVRLPGRVLIFAPSGGFRPLARKLRNQPGARILSRP